MHNKMLSPQVGSRRANQPLEFTVEGLKVGIEVEFALTTVNVVGKSSERSESSPVYRVIGLFVNVLT